MNSNLYLTLSILMLLLSISLHGQDNADSLISKNKVKVIYEVQYKTPENIDTIGYKIYNNKGQLIEEKPAFISNKIKYEYSSNGLVVKKTEFKNLNYKKIGRVWLYKYDEQGQLIKEVLHFKDYKKKWLFYTDELTKIAYINNKKHVYKHTSYYESSEIYEIKYKEKYKQSAFKIERFDRCGNLIYLYEYGEDKNLKECNFFISLCPDLLQKESYSIDTSYTQNEVGKFVQQTILKKHRKSVYHYNNTGQLLQIAQFQFEKNRFRYRNKEKKYNGKGQLVQFKTSYNWNNCQYSTEIAVHKTHKKYEYYPNGLLHKMHFFDENGYENQKLTDSYSIEYLIEYYP